MTANEALANLTRAVNAAVIAAHPVDHLDRSMALLDQWAASAKGDVNAAGFDINSVMSAHHCTQEADEIVSKLMLTDTVYAGNSIGIMHNCRKIVFW